MKRFFSSVYFQITLLGSSFLVLYTNTLVELGKDWLINPNFSHGFFVPPITLFMVWRQKGDLLKSAMRPSDWGIVALALGLFLHIVGSVSAELFTMRFSIIVTLFGLALYLFGWEIGRKVFIPIAFLIFMIPIPAIIWNQLAFPLQLFASHMSAYAIQLTGIPLLREGNILHLANTSLEVVDACSGLRSLTSLLALNGLLAYISSLKLLSKWILFFSAVPIAIAANVFRLIVTAILVQHFGAAAAEGFAHEAAGLFVFLAACFLLLCTYGALSKVERIFVR